MPARPPRPSSLDPEVAAFVERLGSAFTEAGFPRLPARVFSSLLATEDGRLTATELVETLAVSPAAVSGAVTYLAGIQLIHREREQGSRRDVYVVRDDAWHDMMLSTARIYDPFIRALAEGVATVGGADTRAGARLALSVEFLEFVSVEVAGIAERWEARRALGGPRDRLAPDISPTAPDKPGTSRSSGPPGDDGAGSRPRRR